MKLMEASNAFVSMNQKLKETHSILNVGDQFAADDSRAEFLSGGNKDGIIWAMPIAHLVRVPLQYADEVDALVAQFLADKSKPVVEEVKEETKEEPKEEAVSEKPKKKSTAKKSTAKKTTSTKKKKASENVDEVKE